MQAKLLTDEEQITKIRQYKQSGDAALQLEILESCEPYVWKRAIKCNRSKCESHLKDLVSEGRVGLMTALERFDPDRGFTFLTFAHFHIEVKIQKFNKLNYSPITIPVGTLYQIDKLKWHSSEFFVKNDRYPTIGELARISGYKREKVALLMDQTKDYISLDIKKKSAASIMDQNAPDPVREAIQKEMDANLRGALAQLPQIERKIICRRFGIQEEEFEDTEGFESGEKDQEEVKPKTLVEIGEELGFSYEWIRLLEKKAMKKLEKHLTNA